MSLRPPRQYTSALENPFEAELEHEVLAEKASTLSRLTRKLDDALAKLAASERRLEELTGSGEGDETTRQRIRREHRAAEAAEALWHVIIQRELCGLRQHRTFMDDLQVPRAIRLRMGPKKIRQKDSPED